MHSFDEEIARHLQQATTSGELSRAEGYGKPTRQDSGWDDTPQAMRMPFKILKDAAVAPPESEIFRARAALAAQMRDCTDAQKRAELMRQLSQLEQSIALRLEALRAYCRDV